MCISIVIKTKTKLVQNDVGTATWRAAADYHNSKGVPVTRHPNSKGRANGRWLYFCLNIVVGVTSITFWEWKFFIFYLSCSYIQNLNLILRIKAHFIRIESLFWFGRKTSWHWSNQKVRFHLRLYLFTSSITVLCIYVSKAIKFCR